MILSCHDSVFLLALRAGQFANALGFGEPANVLQGTTRMILRALRAPEGGAEASNNPGQS